MSYINNWGSYMLFKEHHVHFHLEEYHTIKHVQTALL
jgi:hypothetical protein